MIVCAYLLAREPMTFCIRRSTSFLSVQYTKKSRNSYLLVKNQKLKEINLNSNSFDPSC